MQKNKSTFCDLKNRDCITENPLVADQESQPAFPDTFLNLENPIFSNRCKWHLPVFRLWQNDERALWPDSLFIRNCAILTAVSERKA